MGFAKSRNFILMVFLSTLASIGTAEPVAGNLQAQSAKFGMTQQSFIGLDNKSFAKGSPGYALELSTNSGGAYFRYLIKARFAYSEGKQNFSDTNNTIFNSTYKYMALSPELGVTLYPVKRRDAGLNLYLWATGIVSYNYLDLGVIPTGSNLKSRDQGYGLGYSGGVGFELVVLPGRKAGGRYFIYGEAGFRDERIHVLSIDNFEVSGLTVCLGLGF